jgi:hypothetical protein
MKNCFLIAVLAMCSLGVLSAKSYGIVLSKPTKVGTLALKPGVYRVKVDGTNAVFTDTKYKTFSTPVKVETGAKKYDETRVETTKDGDADHIVEIDLGGSTTKLGF